MAMKYGRRLVGQPLSCQPLGLLPESAWTCAIDTAGQPRPVDDTGLPVAQVAELTSTPAAMSSVAGVAQRAWPVR